jgi:hypothetical protein
MDNCGEAITSIYMGTMNIRTTLSMAAILLVAGAGSMLAQVTSNEFRVTSNGNRVSLLSNAVGGNGALRLTRPTGMGVLLGSAFDGLTNTLDVTYGKLNLADNTNYVTGILNVANGGTGVNTLPVGAILVGNGTGPVTTTNLTNGQLLIGNTGNPPTAATLTAGTGVTITNGAGSITIAVNSAALGNTAQVTTTTLNQDYTITAPFNLLVGARAIVTLTAPHNHRQIATVTTVNDVTDQVSVHLSGTPTIAGRIVVLFQNP